MACIYCREETGTIFEDEADLGVLGKLLTYIDILAQDKKLAFLEVIVDENQQTRFEYETQVTIKFCPVCGRKLQKKE